jgi:hypothetical protein
MSIKLKALLEGYAWERKADGSLPTLKDAIAVHEANEANSALETKIAKLEKEIADLKHQYYSVSNLAPEREKQLRQQMGEKGRELNRAKRERKTGGSGYQGNQLKKEPKEPRWQDNDGDGKWYEPEDLNEYGEDEFDRSSQMYGGGKSRSEGKEILDLVSEAEDMVQRLRSNMATNSVLQRTEKMGYLKAYDELLDLLSEIGYQSEME